MCCEASAAKRIISTALIAKFGAKNDVGVRRAAAACSPSRSKPEVPITTCTPAARHSQRVVQRRVGPREVDDDVGVAEDVGERGPERRVGAARQLHVAGALDGGDDGLPHPSRGAGHGDADRHATAAASRPGRDRLERRAEDVLVGADRRRAELLGCEQLAHEPVDLVER